MAAAAVVRTPVRSVNTPLGHNQAVAEWYSSLLLGRWDVGMVAGKVLGRLVAGLDNSQEESLDWTWAAPRDFACLARENGSPLSLFSSLGLED